MIKSIRYLRYSSMISIPTKILHLTTNTLQTYIEKKDLGKTIVEIKTRNFSFFVLQETPRQLKIIEDKKQFNE